LLLEQDALKRGGWLVVLAVLALAGVSYGLYRSSYLLRGYSFVGTELEQPQTLRSITLLGAAGTPVSFPDAWLGNIVLVFFGYANGPDVCPLTMAKLAETYRSLGEPRDLQVVMVTVDPERDSAEQIAQYAQNFHSSFVGLSGDKAAIATTAKTLYVGYANQADGEVMHNSQVALLDRSGKMRLLYTQDTLSGLADGLDYILASKGW
jgi:protein SCO1